MLSKLDLTVQYVPGKDNVVDDAMSRFAYLPVRLSRMKAGTEEQPPGLMLSRSSKRRFRRAERWE
jgi:hypothetical protein